MKIIRAEQKKKPNIETSMFRYGDLERIAKITGESKEHILSNINKCVQKGKWKFYWDELIHDWQLDTINLYGNTIIANDKVRAFGERLIEEEFLKRGYKVKVNCVESDLGKGYIIETSQEETRRKENGVIWNVKKK